MPNLPKAAEIFEPTKPLASLGLPPDDVLLVALKFRAVWLARHTREVVGWVVLQAPEGTALRPQDHAVGGGTAILNQEFKTD